MVMNYKQKEEKYNDIISGLNENLEGLVGRLKDDIKAQNKILNPITADMPDSCGSIEKNAFNENEQLTAQDLKDIREAEFNVSEIKAEILSNKIKFPDGAIRSYESGVTPFQIASSISEGLARNIISAKFNGKIIETSFNYDLSNNFLRSASVF